MKVPNALEMQDLKYGERSDAEKDRLAAALLGEGRRGEALLLYDGRPEHPFVKEEAIWAVGQGAAFHLFSIRTMGRQVTNDEIRACAEAAEQRGRFLDARHCYLALDDEAAIQKIAEHLPDALKSGPEAPAAE